MNDLEIRQLCVRARQGSDSAREQLLRMHLGLVTHVAHYFHRSGAFLDMGDLVQQGCLGLLRAIEKYNPRKRSRGVFVKFSTYAHFWISHFIRREIENHGRTIAIPVHRQKKMKEPVLIPLDTRCDSEDDGLSPDAMLADLQDAPDNWCRPWEVRREVNRLIARLPPRTQGILAHRYGLGGQPALTQVQTAQQLGVSVTYVGLLERQALCELRQVSPTA